MASRQKAEINLEIPADKAAIIDRAREMEAGNWKALEDMTDAELDEWEAELEGAYVHQTGAHGSARYNVQIHPHNQTRLDAISAVTAERDRRYKEFDTRSRNLLYKQQYIVDGAEAARKAVELLDLAFNIDAGRFAEVPEPPVMDVALASDAEMDKMAATCRDIERAGTVYDNTADMASSIAVVNTDAAKSIYAELAEIAEKRVARVSAARELLEAIREEKERREHERQQAAEKRAPEAMEARIAELENMLTA